MPGTIAFAYPAVLFAALALPLAYLVLRLLPPSPRRVRLPSFRLIGAVELPPPPSARPPWWLVLLRLGMLTLFLVGLAGPRFEPTRAEVAPDRLALVVDNGWAAASQWDRIAASITEHIDALPPGTRFAIVPTASDPQPGFVDGETAKARIAALAPQSWPGDRKAAAARIPAGVPAIWFADGLEDAGAALLRGAIAGGEILVTQPIEPAFRAAGRTRGGWSGQVAAPPGVTASIELRAARGERIEQEPLAFTDGVATFRIELDPQARGRVARLAAGSSAQAIFLGDEAGERPRAVVVEAPSNEPPLESGAFYVRRAIEPHAEVASATLAEAAADPANLFLLVDVAANEEQAAALLSRVERGAVAILFAGPRVAENGTALSPVPLRSGARALGGVLSWQQPQQLAGFAPDGPLAGLSTNDEARVSRQLLGITDTGVERWAWLSDGTPVVSAARRGDGLLVLVHTAADPSWSSLPLTGLFEAILKRLLPLGRNPAATDIAATKPWVLERMLGARGELLPPPQRVTIAAERFDAAVASRETPPGVYRSGDVRRPLNLASALGPRFAFEPLRTDGLRAADAANPPVDIGRWLLVAAALLALVDLLVAMRLRGLIAAFAILSLAGPARAADVEMGYVGGSASVQRGLDALGEVLARRTAVAPGKAVAIDPARDALGRFAVLYWPAAAAPRMSPQAASRIREYMAAGGLVLFDFGQPLGAQSGARALLAPLGLPALAEVGPEHVLSKSFYLLPGFAGGAVWVEAGTEGASGRVSGVVIGGGDWAALWSGDKPASPAQREMALRFGVNLVMYALTGTYKADQVHTRALLDRIGEGRQ